MTSIAEMPTPQSLLTSIKTFASSPKQFQVLHTLPQKAPILALNPPQTLYILDSSFNPPTFAHLRICTSALQDDHKAAGQEVGLKRLLLLLATQNADKPAKPAAFEQRLKMMCLLAQELHACTQPSPSTQDSGEKIVPIDIGVTKLPIFIDKVKEIADSGIYGNEAEQVHLIGFDTLVRLLDKKYYPPEHTLKPLEALFGRHRVRVTRRTDDAWGGSEEQDAYIKALAEGKREREGGKSDWGKKIELVGGRKEGDEIVSSTKVRAAIGSGDRRVLETLVTGSVAEWIVNESLYEGGV